MVLYHADGRVVIEHEHYLEQQARRLADQKRYEEQVDICKGRGNAPASTNHVRIIIDKQNFKTLYCQSGESWGSRWEDLERFNTDADEEIPLNIDRNTLRLCSNLADEHFRFKPRDDRIHLPVKVPRRHVFGYWSTQAAFLEEYDDLQLPPTDKRYVDDPEPQMAYIRSKEIIWYIIPWLQKVQANEERHKKKTEKGKQPLTSNHPGRQIYAPKPSPHALEIEIPRKLTEKLHLYNAMLQLGLPNFFKEPLIKAIVLEMYMRRLSACHLDILEMTIGRLYSRGIAILDPVFSHFIGTYAFRSSTDRRDPGEYTPLNDVPYQNSDPKKPDDGYGPTDFNTTNRRLLDFTTEPAGRPQFPNDTYIMPPELPVIGHSIRNWSGIRPNGGTAAAHTGYPLNVGKSKKFIRRNSREGIDERDIVEINGNMLACEADYRNHRPGTRVAPESSNEDDSGEEEVSEQDEGEGEDVEEDDDDDE